MSSNEAIDWEAESRKRQQWDEENGYRQSHQSLLGGCRSCNNLNRKERCCPLITSRINRVDLFSSCRLKNAGFETKVR